MPVCWWSSTIADHTVDFVATVTPADARPLALRTGGTSITLPMKGGVTNFKLRAHTVATFVQAGVNRNVLKFHSLRNPRPKKCD